MRKLVVAVLIVLFLFKQSALADVLFTNNNMMFIGEIVEEDDNEIKIKMEGKIATFPKKKVKKILYEDRVEASPIEEYKVRIKELNPNSGKEQYKFGIFCYKRALYGPALEALEAARTLELAYRVKAEAFINKIKESHALILYYLSEQYYRRAKFEQAYDYISKLLAEYTLSDTLQYKANKLFKQIEEEFTQEKKEFIREDVESFLKMSQVVAPRNFAEHEVIMDIITEQGAKKSLLIKYLKEAKKISQEPSDTVAKFKEAFNVANVVYSIIAYRHALDDLKLQKKALLIMDGIEKRERKFLLRNLVLLYRKKSSLIKSILYALPTASERNSYCNFFYELGDARMKKYKKEAKKIYLTVAIKCFDIVYACSEDPMQARMAILKKLECETMYEA